MPSTKMYSCMVLCFFSLCILCPFSISRAASVSKKNESKLITTTKRVSKNSTFLVTTRSLFDGTVKQETCRCVPFYSCDKENYYQSEDDRNACPSTDVCCRVETPLDLDFDTIQVPNANSNPSVTKTCRCVPYSECRQISSSAEREVGITNPKPSSECNDDQVCCPNYEKSVSSNVSAVQEFKCGERRGASSIDIRVQAPDDLSSTEFSEFPWMASVWETSDNKDNEFICGASLLSANIVLTAAHCLKKEDPSTLRVRVGDYDVKGQTSEELAPYQEKTVSSVVKHPNFDSRTLVNDLAIITTEGPFEFASHVTPVCTSLFGSEFADSKAYNSNECLATGWGKSSATSPEKLSVTLKKVDLKVVPFDQCQEKLRTTRLTQNFNLDRSFLCAGGVEGFDTCKGDGGGPLMCPLIADGHRYVQIGVTSWGVGCGNDIPGVYASLEANNDWLSSVLK